MLLIGYHAERMVPDFLFRGMELLIYFLHESYPDTSLIKGDNR